MKQPPILPQFRKSKAGFFRGVFHVFGNITVFALVVYFLYFLVVSWNESSKEFDNRMNEQVRQRQIQRTNFVWTAEGKMTLEDARRIYPNSGY